MHAKPLAAALAAAALLLGSGAAFANDTRDARNAMAAVKAKLDLNERSGLSGAAADAQSRARIALDRAKKAFDDGKESRALAIAKEADALADLAAASKDRQAAVADARANEAALTPQ